MKIFDSSTIESQDFLPSKTNDDSTDAVKSSTTAASTGFVHVVPGTFIPIQSQITLDDSWYNKIRSMLLETYNTNTHIPKNVLYEMYITKNLSMTQIAYILNTGIAKVFNDIKYYGDIPSKKYSNNKITKNSLKKLSEFGWGIGKHPLLKRKYRLVNSSGYVQLYIPEHHLADKNGYVYEHRLVAEDILGRDILPQEIVHHRDGNKQNNTQENLDIMSQSEHIKLTHDILSKFHGVKTGFPDLEDSWLNTVGGVFEVFCSKNADYGPNNIAALGQEGIVVRLFDKFSRIKRLIFDNNGNNYVSDEDVNDTIVDMIDYGIILLMVRKGLWPKYEELNFSSWDSYDDFKNWIDIWEKFV